MTKSLPDTILKMRQIMFETIKYLREQKKFSQAQVADYLGVSRQMYIKYERGETEPPVSVIKELCRLYKVDYDVILEDKHRQKDAEYSIKEQMPLEFADSGIAANPNPPQSLYFREILSRMNKLNTDELIKLAARALDCAQKKKKTVYREWTMEESLAMHEKLSGCIKNRKIENWREEYYAYLDERYGQEDSK